MLQREPSWKRRLVAAALSASVMATACSGGGSAADPALAAEAETNQQALELDGDIATTQLLDATTGEITSLSEVVTGDRAVLLWYWAPH